MYKRLPCLIKMLVLSILVWLIWKLWGLKHFKRHEGGHIAIIVDNDGQEHVYNSQTGTFLFIGGHPRSGTTLVRAMLDAHPLIRCGEETRIIPRMIQMRDSWMRSDRERHRLAQGGVSSKVVDSAVAAFILETMVQHGEPAQLLCDKDPLALKSGSYISRLFPKSKFLFVVRDGRAVAHSVVTRKITITGYDLNNPRSVLERWNSVVQAMDQQCEEIGRDRCLIVHYEQVVLHPARWMNIILDFVEIPWNEMVLHHQDFINKPGGISVSNAERSSDQIVKPINVEALSKWVGTFPKDVIMDMADIAPMLSKLGYDPAMNPPIYGIPDKEVINNTKQVAGHKDFWETRAKQLLKEMQKNE